MIPNLPLLQQQNHNNNWRIILLPKQEGTCFCYSPWETHNGPVWYLHILPGSPQSTHLLDSHLTAENTGNARSKFSNHRAAKEDKISKTRVSPGVTTFRRPSHGHVISSPFTGYASFCLAIQQSVNSVGWGASLLHILNRGQILWGKY